MEIQIPEPTVEQKLAACLECQQRLVDTLYHMLHMPEHDGFAFGEGDEVSDQDTIIMPEDMRAFKAGLQVALGFAMENFPFVIRPQTDEEPTVQ